RRQAEAEEAEDANGDGDVAHAQAGIDDQRPADIGKDLDQHDVPGVFAAHLRGGDVVALPDFEHQAAHDAHDRRRRGEGYRQHDVDAGGADGGDDHHVEDEDGEGEDDVAEAGQQFIDPAAVVARRQPHRDAHGIGAGG